MGAEPKELLGPRCLGHLPCLSLLAVLGVLQQHPAQLGRPRLLLLGARVQTTRLSPNPEIPQDLRISASGAFPFPDSGCGKLREAFFRFRKSASSAFPFPGFCGKRFSVRRISHKFSRFPIPGGLRIFAGSVFPIPGFCGKHFSDSGFLRETFFRFPETYFSGSGKRPFPPADFYVFRRPFGQALNFRGRWGNGPAWGGHQQETPMSAENSAVSCVSRPERRMPSLANDQKRKESWLNVSRALAK